MDDLKVRFIEAYEYLRNNGMVNTYKDFAEKLSISTSMITEIVKGRSNVGTKAIQNIVIEYPINPKWLLTGKGSILSSDEPVSQVATPAPNDSSAYYKMYKEKDAEVGQLREEIGALKSEIRQLKEGDDFPRKFAPDVSTDTALRKGSGARPQSPARSGK